MLDRDRMEKQVIKIADVMHKVEELVRKEIKDKDDSLLVAGALLAITRNLYVQSIGIQDTAKMFEAVADSFMITEEFVQQLKPTLH
jgi:flagellar biosynthesis component FlhA